MIVVDGDMKEEIEYIGRLYGSLSGIWSDFSIEILVKCIYTRCYGFIW